METIKKSWKITNTKVDKLIRYVFSSILMVAIVLFILAFLGCSKEEVPVQKQDTATSLKGGMVEDRSETVPVVIKGKDFGKDKKAIRVRVNGKEVEVMKVEDKEITVAVPIEYKGKLKVEVFQHERLVLQTTLESLNLTWVSTVAGSTEGYVDGPVATARFDSPYGVVVDANGTIYVADEYNHKIRKIDPNGMVSTLAGSISGFADGQGTDAQFRGPRDVAVDANGNVFVADSGNDKIRKITPNGYVSTVAGYGTGFADGEGTMAQFDGPWAIDVDALGNIYVADHWNNKIRKITPELSWTPNGGFSTVYMVRTLAGSTNGDVNGPGANAKFWHPSGIAVDTQGYVYVSDTGNHKIRKIKPNGMVSTLAGGGSYGFANGMGTMAKFYHPIGIAVDDGDNAYVADRFNNKIRKIAPDGSVTTLAGSDYGFKDGYWALSSFASPTGVAVGPMGNVYVADGLNNKIRKITLDD